MAPHAIVSYDDTRSDLDALMLARILRSAGARLTLAYVRHAPDDRSEREQSSRRRADALLATGAQLLGDEQLPRRVVLSPATGAGLVWLAHRERAELIVFGSEYRTRTGHVAPGRSAQTLLEGGPVALALAPAGYADAPERPIDRVAVLEGSADAAAVETAFSLAHALDANVVDPRALPDLVVVGSRPDARPGRVSLTARALSAIDEAGVPVLILAAAVPVSFSALVGA